MDTKDKEIADLNWVIGLITGALAAHWLYQFVVVRPLYRRALKNVYAEFKVRRAAPEASHASNSEE